MNFSTDDHGTFFGYHLALSSTRWLTKGGESTRDPKRKGLWPTEAEARAALDRMPDEIREEVLTKESAGA